MAQQRQTEDVIQRLARIEGHVQEVKKMVREGHPCPEVLLRLATLRSDLDQAGRVLLKDHLEHCLPQAVEQGTVEAHLPELEVVLMHFMT